MDRGRPPPPLEELDPSDETSEGGTRRFVSETVRKAVLTGLGAVFLTEEGARKAAREWKLPKEIVSYISAQAGGARDEIVRVVSEEVRKFFESDALRKEFLRLLSSMSLEVHAEIRFKPDKGGVSPELKVTTVKPRSRRSRSEPGEEEP